MDFHIETASWRDLNSVRQLEQICFPLDAWPIWDLVAVLTLPTVIHLKAVSGGKLVGFIAGDIRKSENISWIATVGVLPEFRHQGLGKALMDACEALLPTASAKLCVRITNSDAIRLYQYLGYSRVGIWPQYYQDREDALIMEKSLAKTGL